MKKNDVKVGSTYTAKVNDRLVPVRVVRHCAGVAAECIHGEVQFNLNRPSTNVTLFSGKSEPTMLPPIGRRERRHVQRCRRYGGWRRI